MDDPDAPSGTFTHWVLYNIAPGTTSLAEGIATTPQVPGVGTQGTNSARGMGYTPPCPPSGTHRYFFKLFALDADLRMKAGLSARDLQTSMEGHVLGQAQLMGRYSR
jgi:hypothetical protein